MSTCGAVPAVLRAGLALAVAGGLAVPLGCSKPPSRPNVLLISVDTLRADHLGCYRYRRPTSAFIDSLAASGVLFESAFSPSPWTLPGHASMLTGVSPFRHGATQETRGIREDIALLPEALRASGYQTVGIINGPFVRGRYGFSRGFETFVEVFDRKDESYLPRLLEIFEGLDGRPFFAFVHFMQVHSPYAAPAPHRFNAERGPTAAADGRRMMELDRRVRAREVQLTEQDRDYLIALYDSGIRAVDRMVAETVARARLRAGGRLLVVLTSDHGEEFLEHGGLLHGRTLYDEALHVPLIIAGAGVPMGKRVDRLASLLDVVPTILGVAGVPVPAGVEGRNLLAGAGSDSSLLVPLQTSAHDGNAHLRGARTASRKVITDDLSGHITFFALDQDPGEQHPAAVQLFDPLLGFLRGLRVPPTSGLRPPEGSELEALRSLGYHD